MTLNSPYHPKATFLHRNWLSSIKGWASPAMGNVASSPECDGPRNHHRPDNGVPPLKRPRLASDASNIDGWLAEPDGSPGLNDALRIDVYKIFHKDSKKVRSQQTTDMPRGSTPTKATCKITVSGKADGRSEVLFCQSQVCDILAFPNPVGPHRVTRVMLPRPFTIPVESILVNRVDDASVEFADDYQVLVELKAAATGVWPPLDSSDFSLPLTTPGPSERFNRHMMMSAQCERLFGRHKSPLTVKTGVFPDQTTRSTDYLMDVDIRWSSGFRATMTPDRVAMQCITAIDPDENEVSELEDLGAAADEVSSLARQNGALGEDQTPSRSLRAREKDKNYNLKMLSDRAHGRQRRKRGTGAPATDMEGQVTYVLSSDQPVNLDYHRCVVCGHYHQDIQQLQVHFQMVHSNYDFMLDTSGRVPLFRVTRRSDPDRSPSKTFQLSRPTKPFVLESFIAGDQSWITSRMVADGIDHPEASPTPKATSFMDRLRQTSPTPRAAKVTQKRAEMHRKKILVPETGQPVFHPISKALLKPGQEVPKTVADNSWLLQKHRDAIGEFSDVDPPEKEYIREWDGFILQESITSPAYLPRAWLKFIGLKADWLVAEKSRVQEMGNHLATLRLNMVLTAETMEQGMALLDEARDKIEFRAKPEPELMTGVVNGTSPASKSEPIGKGACGVCRLLVLAPPLVCANKACVHPLYHADCADETGDTPAGAFNWLCSNCTHAKSEPS